MNLTLSIASAVEADEAILEQYRLESQTARGFMLAQALNENRQAIIEPLNNQPSLKEETLSAFRLLNIAPSHKSNKEAQDAVPKDIEDGQVTQHTEGTGEIQDAHEAEHIPDNTEDTEKFNFFHPPAPQHPPGWGDKPVAHNPKVAWPCLDAVVTVVPHEEPAGPQDSSEYLSDHVSEDAPTFPPVSPELEESNFFHPPAPRVPPGWENEPVAHNPKPVTVEDEPESSASAEAPVSLDEPPKEIVDAVEENSPAPAPATDTPACDDRTILLNLRFNQNLPI
ncbi:unnamed protein product [Fusarium equiseti]|uniref:Uncharacterized protein n=1 Tax=Fusarium equiseti TaxID=61235 RepID=A0A8J2J1F8_FUSEQ|nr:unnamed protein product [Fusarium equiseti]